MTFGLGCLDLFGHATDSGTDVDLGTDRGKPEPSVEFASRIKGSM
jgi:hypothetical protein